MTTELRRVFRLLPQALQWRWMSLLPLVLLAALVEATAAAAVFTLLQLLTPSVPGQAIATGRLARVLLGARGEWPTTTFALVVMGLYVARLLLLLATTLFKERVGHSTVAVLSELALRRYLAGALPQGRDTAMMLERVERSPEIVAGALLGSVVHLIAEVAVVVALVVLLAVSAPLPTLLAIVLTLVGLLAPAAVSQSVFRRWGAQETVLHEQLQRELAQGFGALREIRIYGRELFFRSRFLRERRALSGVQRRRSLASDGLRLGIETGFVLVLLVVVLMVLASGSSSSVISLLGLYAYAGFRLVPSANRITLNLNSIRGAIPFARALAADAERARQEDAGSQKALGPIAFETALTLSHVSFQYAPDAPLVLEDVSLSIAPGESIGIVGASGSGKSTLLDLILGLITPTTGTVAVDGRDIHSNLRSWQGQIGYVAQTFYLLSDSLAQNIAFGLEPNQIDQARLGQAVRAASLERFVHTLPEGTNTPLGERGARLSGGERQRVAIARALYAEPSVLLFDEATSALDPQTEQEVNGAIAALQGARTVIVVAHRISAVRSCDRIVMLREGRVAASGTFDELAAHSAEFRALVAAGDASPSD